MIFASPFHAQITASNTVDRITSEITICPDGFQFRNSSFDVFSQPLQSCLTLHLFDIFGNEIIQRATSLNLRVTPLSDCFAEILTSADRLGIALALFPFWKRFDSAILHVGTIVWSAALDVMSILKRIEHTNLFQAADDTSECLGCDANQRYDREKGWWLFCRHK